MAKTKVQKTPALSQTWRDARTSILIVSVLTNAFFLVGYAVLKMTDQYDTVLASTLLHR